MMGLFKAATAVLGLAALTACGATNSYPGRTQVQFMSADQVTQRTYACLPGETERQTQSRASSAHRYVDGAIRSAGARLAAQSTGGFGSGLGLQAELNAEIAEISRQSEAEYRCVLVSSRNTSGPFG